MVYSQPQRLAVKGTRKTEVGWERRVQSESYDGIVVRRDDVVLQYRTQNKLDDLLTLLFVLVILIRC